MRHLLIALALTSVACGHSGSNGSPGVKPIPTQPVGTTKTIHMVAQRDQTNSNPATYMITQTTTVILGDGTNITSQSNAGEFYHVDLLMGSVDCNYQHQVNANTMSNASCTTTKTYVVLQAGDLISLSLQSGMTQSTSVDAAITLTF